MLFFCAFFLCIFTKKALFKYVLYYSISNQGINLLLSTQRSTTAIADNVYQPALFVSNIVRKT